MIEAEPFSCYWPHVIAAVTPRSSRHAFDVHAVEHLLSRFGRTLVRDGHGWLIDLTHNQHRHGPWVLAAHLDGLLNHKGRFGLGIAPGIELARYISLLEEETIGFVSPWQVQSLMTGIEPEKLLSAFPGTLRRLRAAGVKDCGHIATLPVERLSAFAGRDAASVRRICRAEDREFPGTIGDLPGYASVVAVLPPRTSSHKAVLSYLKAMCKRLARRLNLEDQRARALRFQIEGECRVDRIVADLEIDRAVGVTEPWGDLARKILKENWLGGVVTRLEVCVDGVEHRSGQLSLF